MKLYEIAGNNRLGADWKIEIEVNRAWNDGTMHFKNSLIICGIRGKQSKASMNLWQYIENDGQFEQPSFPGTEVKKLLILVKASSQNIVNNNVTEGETLNKNFTKYIFLTTHVEELVRISWEVVNECSQTAWEISIPELVCLHAFNLRKCRYSVNYAEEGLECVYLWLLLKQRAGKRKKIRDEDCKN